jgi:hypothetical protein
MSTDRIATQGGSRLSRREALAALASLAPVTPTRAIEKTRTLKFTFSRPKEDPRTQWLIAVYTELLARLSLNFEFMDVPAGRGTVMALSGKADGELGRTAGYATLYPSLLPLTEPNNRVEFAIYGMAEEPRFSGWAQVRRSQMKCEYRRGIAEIKHLLDAELAASQVSTVASIEQGVRRLQLGRTDRYLDVKEAMEDFFRFKRGSEALQQAPQPIELSIVQQTTGHAYLRAEHADLIGPMSAMLKRMKAEGLVQRMLNDALCNAAPHESCQPAARARAASA